MTADFRDLPTARRIDLLGHRAFVGGTDAEMWYGIGLLQFQFLVAQGLRPHHVFLDVACGPLRLGQYLIPFLEVGHYFGLEAEPDLVRIGLERELRFGLGRDRQPKFGHGYDFDMSFADPFDFAIAQSLFTHLVPADIVKCLSQLRSRAHAQSSFYFTFFEGDSSYNPLKSHANRNWLYCMDELHEMATGTGWVLQYLGDWQHPRHQKMVLAKPL